MGALNFEGFQHLLHRIAQEWYEQARREHRPDFVSICEYLNESPFTARQTPSNEAAYEMLMDTRMRLYVSAARALQYWTEPSYIFCRS